MREFYKNGKTGNGLYSYVATNNGLKVHVAKSISGRGRRVTPWVSALHVESLEEFERLRKLGVKFNAGLFRELVLNIISESDSLLFGSTAKDPKSGKLVSTHITTRWVQSFMQRNNIVARTQSGKLSVSPQKEELIEREVAFHLGQLSRDFSSGLLKEDNVFNADETHFKLDTNDGRTLAMRGDENIKFADIVSGNEGMTLMLTLGGGSKARMEVPMLIFKNSNSSYPIRGLEDRVPGVCYRSQPKGWMDMVRFQEWIKEPRVFQKLSNGEKRILFVDNAGGHSITDTVKNALLRSNTELRLLPKNATDLCQPADSFIIQKVKTAWRKIWDQKRLSMVSEEAWTDWKNGSGKLPNPGKKFFLELAAQAVRDVASQRDSDGVLYVRKAMIRCGMALNLNGQWEVKQLFPHLQTIVAKYRENFDGKEVADSLLLDGELTESDSD